jgi:putative transcriptional regulator
MTKLGEFLARKSVNKGIVARKTGLNKQRMGEITVYSDEKIRAKELYLIALAINVSPCEIFSYVCKDLKLIEPTETESTHSRKSGSN